MSWADVQDVVKRAALADVAFDIFSSHAFMKAPPPCRYPLSIAWRMLFSSFPLSGILLNGIFIILVLIRRIYIQIAL